jgi:hypothetical protein
MRNTFIAPLRRGFFLWYTSIYDHLTMRYIRGRFVVTGPDISPMLFKSRPEARGWCKTHYPGSPITEIGANAVPMGRPRKAPEPT